LKQQQAFREAVTTETASDEANRIILFAFKALQAKAAPYEIEDQLKCASQAKIPRRKHWYSKSPTGLKTNWTKGTAKSHDSMTLFNGGKI
jgi:hypothetical protein